MIFSLPFQSSLKEIVSTGTIIGGVESEQKLKEKQTENKLFGDGKHKWLQCSKRSFKFVVSCYVYELQKRYLKSHFD